jgi:hypothetical protein
VRCRSVLGRSLPWGPPTGRVIKGSTRFYSPHAKEPLQALAEQGQTDQGSLWLAVQSAAGYSDTTEQVPEGCLGSCAGPSKPWPLTAVAIPYETYPRLPSPGEAWLRP